MEVVRRNTDYALRAMLNLAGQYENEPISSRDIARQGQIPYQLNCKLMQKLHNAKLVKSSMGPKGGFRLSKNPSKISLLRIIEVIQGKVRLNRCLLAKDVCPQQKKCRIKIKLVELDRAINSYLSSITLDELAKAKYKR